MLPYPHIDPVIWDLGIGQLKIRWYGCMYMLSFVGGWFLLRYRAKCLNLNLQTGQISDLVFYVMLGVILGGRLGYFLFYETARLWSEPLDVLKIWQGGMSFHGGLLGVGLAVWVYKRHNNCSFFMLTDFLVPVVPLGLAAGRLGNFINGELWGRVTQVPWAMVFPRAGSFPRHPSQLYEFFLEGVFLFVVLWYYARKPRGFGAVTACFLFFYGLVRFIVEYFRQPDWQQGFLMGSWLTMGQLLSLPMIIIGCGWWYVVWTRKTDNQTGVSN